MRLLHRSSRGAAKPAREPIGFPLTPEPYRAYETVCRSGSDVDAIVAARKRAIELVPYSAGQSVFVNLGTDREPEIVLTRVVRVFVEYQERSGEYLPMWRIQTATRDGYWSQQWRYCYPGHIYRAYFVDDDHPRSLPASVKAIADLHPGACA